MKPETKKTLTAVTGVLLVFSTVTAVNYTGLGDIERSQGNRFVAGILDLKLSTYSVGTTGNSSKLNETQGQTVFNATEIRPGASGKAVLGLNLIGNPAWLWIDVENYTERNRSLENSTNAAGLGKYLDFRIWYDNGDGKYGNETVLFEGNGTELSRLDTLLDANRSLNRTSYFNPETSYLGISWNLSNTSCSIQNRSTEFDFELSTQQAGHNRHPGTIDNLFSDTETVESLLQAANYSSCGVCASVLAPSGTKTVPRIDGNSTLKPEYTVEQKGDEVKFEDATIDGEEQGLGEEGEVQTDVFNVTTLKGNRKVRVETKAGQFSDGVMLAGENDSGHTDPGFRVELRDVNEEDEKTEYVFSVTSDSEEGKESPALSHVTFKFCPATTGSQTGDGTRQDSTAEHDKKHGNRKHARKGGKK